MDDKQLFDYLSPEIMKDATLYTLWKRYQVGSYGQEQFLREATKHLAGDKARLFDQLIEAANNRPAPPMVLLRDTESWRQLTPGQKRLLRFFAKLGIGRKEAL